MNSTVSNAGCSLTTLPSNVLDSICDWLWENRQQSLGGRPVYVLPILGAPFWAARVINEAQNVDKLDWDREMDLSIWNLAGTCRLLNEEARRYIYRGVQVEMWVDGTEKNCQILPLCLKRALNPDLVRHLDSVVLHFTNGQSYLNLVEDILPFIAHGAFLREFKAVFNFGGTEAVSRMVLEFAWSLSTVLTRSPIKFSCWDCDCDIDGFGHPKVRCAVHGHETCVHLDALIGEYNAKSETSYRSDICTAGDEARLRALPDES